MTPVATVGGPARMGGPEWESASAGLLRFAYQPLVRRGRVYHLKLSASARLTAALAATDEGFVARCRELGSLGYGVDPQAAVDHLLETTAEYLAFLREDKPSLAPAIAHHAIYVPLLEIPPEAWFVAVAELAQSAPDAT